jgi:membrane carboxypeptidase/penicillin-binding protein PbpC
MGTTPSGHDAWTVGFTPQLVVGVWAGTPTASEPVALPPKIASSLWHAVLQFASQDYPAESWEMPASITRVDVCDPSGMLPTLQCPAVVSEVFLSGQEPTQPDTLYQALQVNRETDRLATVFTPPDLIESRIYLKYPPEASSWAESTGLETPPKIYDVIYAPPESPDADIDSPQMFAYIRGQVDIQGRASGAGFTSYRLQAGQGLNPSGWTVVQEDIPRPVESGVLGTWDTTGLNGLYALQLIVLREDQQVDTTTLQVTVDNLPPALTIPYPDDGESYTQSNHPILTFLVQADDNLGLEGVAFYLDANLLATQTQPPYAYPWASTPGKHVLTIKATDRAGNNSQTSVTFTVE